MYKVKQQRIWIKILYLIINTHRYGGCCLLCVTIYTLHTLPIQSNPNSRFSLVFFYRFTDFSHAVFVSSLFFVRAYHNLQHLLYTRSRVNAFSFYIIDTTIYNGERAGEHTRGEEKELAASADRYVAADGSVSVADSRACYLILSKDVKAKTLITPLKMPI